MGGGWLQVEFYVDDEPERETLLPLEPALSGYRILSPLRGFVWWYPPTCSLQEVRDSVDVHIADRIGKGYRNLGYIDWHQTNHFEPVAA